MKTTTQSSHFSVLVHLPAVDEALPFLHTNLEQLQVAVLNNEDVPVLEGLFKTAGTIAIQTFRREEEAMELCHDPMTHSHKMAHQVFLKTFVRIRRKCLEEGSSVALAQDLRSDLIRWLVDHHRLMNASLGRTVQAMVERSRAYHQSSSASGSSID